MRTIFFALFFAIFQFILLAGCISTRDSVLDTQGSQLQTRNYQSRTFDTGDREMVLRAIISTLQDLNVIIDKADEKLGTISGTSFSNGSKITVSVRAIGQSQILVRANAQAGRKEIADPIPYQNFFNALSQSLFLEAHLAD